MGTNKCHNGLLETNLKSLYNLTTLFIEKDLFLLKQITYESGYKAVGKRRMVRTK